MKQKIKIDIGEEPKKKLLEMLKNDVDVSKIMKKIHFSLLYYTQIFNTF